MNAPPRAAEQQPGFIPTGDLTHVSWEPDGRAERRGRRRVALLALLPLLVGLGCWWWWHPASLQETRLVGTREPGCLRLVIASDVSGSMSSLTRPRDAAVNQLVAWAPQNLRADDELALISFSDETAVEIPPTPVGQPMVRIGRSAPSAGTELKPLLDAVANLPVSGCRTSLLLVGDGMFADLPTNEATARGQLVDAGVDTFDFLVPGSVDIPTNWQAIYPAAQPEFFDGTNPDQTALVFGRHLAALTNQQLQRVTN